MATCSLRVRLRRAVAPLLIFGLVLALPACDSNDDGDALDEVGGRYNLTDLRFRGAGLPTVNLFADSLDNEVQLRQNATELQIASRSGTFRIFYEFAGSGTDEIEGTVSRSDDRLRFDVQSGNPSDLLLPQNEGTDFTLRIRQGGESLQLVSGEDDISRTGVDLRPYGIDQPSVSGRLIVTFARE